jgi:hypothetical protein
MFRIFKRPIEVSADNRKSLANEFARLRTAGASDAEALRILFDMVTTEGPVPEIEVETRHAPAHKQAG